MTLNTAEVDADAERQDGDDGRHARAAQPAQGVARVLPQLVEQALSAGRAQLLFQRFGAPELEPRAPLAPRPRDTPPRIRSSA